MANKSSLNNWADLAKAINDALIFGRLLPRTAAVLQEEAKRITAQTAKSFSQKLQIDLFKSLEIYYKKIMVFCPILIFKNNYLPEKRDKAEAILIYLTEENNTRKRLMEKIIQTKDSVYFIRRVEAFFNNFKEELILTQKHLKDLEDILVNAAKLEQEISPQIQRRAA